MSGPTWLPPRTLGSPERATPPMSHAGQSFYRAQMKVLADQRPKYGAYEQNGVTGGGGGGPTRYIATGPTGGIMQHPEDPGSVAFRPLSPKSGDHYYPPSHGPKDERNTWNPHMAGYDHQVRGPEKHHSNIDAEIDSLTCMLADLDSHPHSTSTQLYDNVPYNKHLSGDRYKPSGPPGGHPQGRPSMGYPPHPHPHPQSQYHPAPPYASDHQASPYNSQLDYSYPSPSSTSSSSSSSAAGHHKPYPQPVPASYTTASTPTGPRFSVQVKTAQPVTTYSQTGRQAEQAYTPPPPPRQHASRPPPQDHRPPYQDHLPIQAQSQPHQHHQHHQHPQQQQQQQHPQGWYSMPPPQAQEMHGSGGAPSGVRASQGPQPPKKGPDASGTVPSPAYQPSKGAVPRPEEELDRLTKKLVYDMNHPPTEEYFGRCARCGDNVLGDGSGCIAMEQVFHVECFTCITCHARLRGQPFYALDKKSYCEGCYISTLERCSKCSNPILDRILRAMGKAYHPRCFTCVVCNCCLDGVPFTVDATSQIHCIDDFHRKFAPRCSVCGQPIMPEPGQEETVRIVALDRSFHVNCYKCEECGLLLSSEGEGRGCYPLDGHILCKGCSARRIQDLSAKISTDC
ncbi:thyroid receptor-interacting protein 6 [Alosa pseudoharengus]|uniref:thyroid receptor-interacting protein 6 n=1 Tax=Alosa pseudoharengus TaxID=34774 RepID=UPI003F89C707